jgi:hypothetical protein
MNTNRELKRAMYLAEGIRTIVWFAVMAAIVWAILKFC